MHASLIMLLGMEDLLHYRTRVKDASQYESNLTRLFLRQNKMTPSVLKMMIGLLRQVGLLIRATIRGRKGQMTVAAKKISPLRKEVPI